MNKDEVFKLIHSTFTGSPGKEHITIKEYEGLSPQDGLRKGLEYLERAKKGVENAGSDMGYWMWRGDESLAHVLIGVFAHLVSGHEDFPLLPDVENKVLMDKQAALSEWARDLLSDHQHIWENCQHTRATDKYPTHPACKQGQVEWGGLYHLVCAICGEDKYKFSSLEAGAKALLEVK